MITKQGACILILFLTTGSARAREDISGVITGIDQEDRSLEISGVKINARNAKVRRLLTPFSLGGLKVGSKVEAQGRFTGPREFTADVVETKYFEHYEINARLDGIDSKRRTLNISGISIKVPAGCAVRDEKNADIALENLPVGRTVEVEGEWTAMAEFTAYEIKAHRPDEEGEGLGVKWNRKYTELGYNFPGGRVHYPRDLSREKFPAPGTAPEFSFEKKWPVVAMRARWSAKTAGWPEQFRVHALDIILMWACDAQLYEIVYPTYIKSSKFTYPPEFIMDALKPDYRLVEALRGKEVAYEVEAKAGFGAADYTIKTRIIIGAGGDGKTFFYHDSPRRISDHLESRDFFFAARDAGDRFDFEVRMVCVCKDIMSLFRGESMRRVEDNGRYFVQRLYEELGEPPTAAAIEDFLKAVKGGSSTLGVIKKHGGKPR